MQDREFRAERNTRLAQQARATREGLLEIPVCPIMIYGRAIDGVGRIRKQGNSRQAVIGARKQAVYVDEAGFVRILPRGPKCELVANRQVDPALERIGRSIRMIEPAAAGLDRA